MFIITSFFVCNIAFAQVVKDSVKIYFRQGYSKLDTSIRDNEEALNSIVDKLNSNYSDSLYRLRKIMVIGGASPEGSVSLNKRLSEKRANVLFNYLSGFSSLPDSLKTFRYLGRDWRGLMRLVENDPNVPFQKEVLDFINDIVVRCENGERVSDNNVGRLSGFKNGEPYRYMYRNLFPELRASRLVVWYDRAYKNPVMSGLADIPELKLPKLQLSPIPLLSSLPESNFFMAIKTNMLYDVLLIPNVGVEFYVGSGLSIATNWMYAWWKNDREHYYWRVYGGDITIRKWFGRKAIEKPLTGHHIGAYFQTVTYDIETGGRGYMGGEPGGDIFDRANWIAGVEYGYSMPVARRMNLDFTLGVGYFWGTYHEYLPKDGCYVWQATKKRNYIGPTKAEISLVWLIGKNNVNVRKGGRL